MRRAVSITALALAAGLLCTAAQAAQPAPAPSPAATTAAPEIPIGALADPRGHGLSVLEDGELLAAAGLPRRYAETLAAAQGGDATAMVLVAVAGNAGVGGERDPKAAFDWAARALKAPGLAPEARGRALLVQSQSTADKAASPRLLEQAAEAGNALALLGTAKHDVFVFDEPGLTRAYQAASQGYAEAQWMLGRHYIQQHAMPDAERLAVAEYWWLLAADQGHSGALLDLATPATRKLPALDPQPWGLTRDDLGMKSSRALLAQARFPARFDAALAAAGAGDATAMTLLALAYESGTGAPIDRVKARVWAEKAAINGSAHGMRVLARLLDAPGPRRDPDLAKKWRELATKNGDTWSRFVATDPCCKELFDLADRGLAPAQYELWSDFTYGAPWAPKDPVKGQAYLKAAADQGYVRAVRLMGQFNPQASAEWFGRAIALGDVQAMRRQADKASPKEALALLRRAAAAAPFPLPDSGDTYEDAYTAVVDARIDLAKLLISGKAGKPAPAEAAALLEPMYRQARDAELTGEAPPYKGGAQSLKSATASVLSQLYSRRLVRLDVDRAFEYIWASLNSFDPAFARQVAASLESGRGLPRDYAKARRWYDLCMQYDPVCARRLGVLREKGLGGSVDKPGALEAYGYAAQKGDAEAAYLVATAMLAGQKVKRWTEFDRDDFLVKALETGRPEAHYAMAVSRFVKDMDKVDSSALKLATQHYRIAAEKGHAKSQDMLAYLYYQGFGVPRDLGEAEKWARKSAAQNDAEGQFELALVLNQLKGAPDAIAWLRKSAAQGYGPAQQTLAHWEAAGVKQRDRLAEFMNGAMDVLVAFGEAAEEINRAREAELQNQVDYVGAMYAMGTLDEYYGLSGGASSDGASGGGSGDGSSSYASDVSGSASGGGSGGGSSGSGGSSGGYDWDSGGYGSSDVGSGGYDGGSGDSGGSSDSGSGDSSGYGSGSSSGSGSGVGGALIIKDSCDAACRQRQAEFEAFSAKARLEQQRYDQKKAEDLARMVEKQKQDQIDAEARDRQRIADEKRHAFCMANPKACWTPPTPQPASKQ